MKGVVLICIKGMAGRRYRSGRGRPRSGGVSDRLKLPSYKSYTGYIYKVLKQVHPDTNISRRASNIVNVCRTLFSHFLLSLILSTGLRGGVHEASRKRSWVFG